MWVPGVSTLTPPAEPPDAHSDCIVATLLVFVIVQLPSACWTAEVPIRPVAIVWPSSGVSFALKVDRRCPES